jgi:hypothetical protein
MSLKEYNKKYKAFIKWCNNNQTILNKKDIKNIEELISNHNRINDKSCSEDFVGISTLQGKLIKSLPYSYEFFKYVIETIKYVRSLRRLEFDDPAKGHQKI